MPEHLLAVIAGPGRDVPQRVAGLPLPSDVEITALQCTHPPRSDDWSIQVSVRVPSVERLELLVKRLNRLVVVRRVVELEPEGHRRQSVYAYLQTDGADLDQVGLLVRQFNAEMLELKGNVLILHLSASPFRCQAFVSLLRPHGLIEVVTSAVTGFRRGGRTINRLPRAACRAPARLP